MKLTVLNSGSSGNGYVLQNETEALILECGCPVKNCIEALDYNTGKVVGCLITHEHGDHAKHVSKYATYFNCYGSTGTVKALCDKNSDKVSHFRLIPLSPLAKYQFGNFTIMPFPTEHDCDEPFGYLIKHPEIGVMVFATDTYFLRYTFAGLTNIMLECNYDLPILQENVRNGIIPKVVEERTLRSHMSLEHCKDVLKANDLSNVSQIILIHLSGNNSEPERFRQEIELLTGKKVLVAKKGLEVPLNTTPF